MELNKIIVQKKNSISRFDAFSFLLLLSLGFILPIFFLPFFSLSVSVSKSILVAVFTTIAFFLWLIARLKDGRFIFPKSAILGAGAVIVLSFLFSAIFSEVPIVSFVGLVGEVGTFSSILLLYLLMFLSSMFFQGQKRVFYLYFALLSAAIVVFFYQLLRFIFLGFNLPFAELYNTIPHIIIGRWADTAVFFGLTAVLSLLTLELVSLRKMVRIALQFTLTLSLLVLLFVNMRLTWIVVGFFSLIIFVYVISFGKSRPAQDSERKIPSISLGVLLISLFFVLAGGALSNSIYSVFNIPQNILRPSFEQTIDITKGTLSENLFLGAGPNRFVNQWLLLKPDGVNNSFAWNVDFNTGIGLVPSFAVTTGAIGIIAWLVFFAAILYSGIKSMFLIHVKESHRYIILSSFLAALYLWIFSIFYVPNITIVFLTFLMTGLLIASLAQAKIIKNYNFSFLNNPRVGFVSVLVLILLIMSSVAGGYMLFQRFLSVGYFQKSISAFNINGDVEKSEENIVRAIRLNRYDLYYRTLAEINLSQLNTILSLANVSDGTSQTKFQSVSRSAIQNALAAINVDETNYLNWLFLARVYESLMPFSPPESLYEGAKQSYARALSLNPHSPRVVLLQARLELNVGNRSAAKSYVAEALSKKNNYTEAIFLLSQIQADEGNVDEAIVTAQKASFVSPNDMGIFFHLGLLQYRKEDYQGAISAFERAVELNTNYANAKYFLGLSYSNEGQRAKALQQFEDIKVLNPDNAEVEKILRNLKADRPALSNVQSPVDDGELPVEEE